MIPAILGTAASSVLSAATSGTSSTSSSSQTLGKDDFLKLLTAQLQNQDPLSPMDNTAFVAQMAQFSSLEQLQNLNDSLTTFLATASGNGIAAATPLLGRTVAVNGSALDLQAGTPSSLNYGLPASAAGVTLQIKGSSGTVVRTLALGAQTAGSHQVAFDGRDDTGAPLASGSYTYSASAVDPSGQTISGIVTGGGQVTGITVDNGQTMLVIGQTQVPLSAVVGVSAGSGS